MASNPVDSLDWNQDDSLFTFTRGRFVMDEKHQMAQRTVRFNMNALASVAASSIGARRCVHVKKCPDGLYNKAYVFQMDDGREVIGKVPNPNAGRPHYTTASEVATMDFMRNVLSTPAPRVITWSSQAESNAVGAEYILMEKAEGVPLRHVWGGLAPSDQLKLLFQVFGFMKAWLANPFPGYGALYYASDVPGKSLPVKRHSPDKRFVVGPALGRDWCDAGRAQLDCDRGPWASVLRYRQAAVDREQTAVQSLPGHTKQMVMLTGPEMLYQPSPPKKLWALGAYSQLLEHILRPKSDSDLQHGDMLLGRLWHNDLHDENIFVDPTQPTRITTIIDWQSTQILPLFDHHMDPAFLDYRGPDIGDNLEKPARLDTTGLSPDEKAAASAEYLNRALMIAWRRLVKGKSPVQYHTARFQETTAGNMLHVARRVYEIGEAHLAALVLNLQDEWAGSGFPISLSLEDEERIRHDANAADTGVHLLTQLKEQMGEAWPDKGLVEHGEYDETKMVLQEARDMFAETCFENEAARKEFVKSWPFDA